MYPEDVSVEVHSTVSLACTAFGAPAPSVVWNSSGLPSISTNASGYTVENRSVVRVGALSLVQSVLHVCGFSLATAGSYTCSAENYAGTTSVTTTLSLNGIHIIVEFTDLACKFKNPNLSPCYYLHVNKSMFCLCLAPSPHCCNTCQFIAQSAPS